MFIYCTQYLVAAPFALITAPNSAKPNLLQNVVVLYVVIIMRSFEGLASSLLRCSVISGLWRWIQTEACVIPSYHGMPEKKH